MQDAWRAYLELALGLTEASKQRAQTVARRLVGQSGATAVQLQTMAEELISTGMANREALTKIVRVEVDRTLGVLGLASTDEVAALAERVRRLERELESARAGGSAPGGLAGAGKGTGSTPQTGARKSSTAGRSTDVRPPTPAATGRTAGSGTTAAGRTTVKKAVAKKTVAKKAVAKKAVAKAIAKKAVAEKAARTVTTAAPTKQVAKRNDATKAVVAKKAVAKKAVVAKESAGRKAAVAKRSPAPGTGAA